MELRLEEVEAREMKSPEKLGKLEFNFWVRGCGTGTAVLGRRRTPDGEGRRADNFLRLRPPEGRKRRANRQLLSQANRGGRRTGEFVRPKDGFGRRTGKISKKTDEGGRSSSREPCSGSETDLFWIGRDLI